MEVLDRRKVITMIRRTLNFVDSRLVDHSTKVAFVLHDMLQTEGELSEEEQRKLRILALFHDVGAYRSEEIDKIVHFETKNVWAHSVNSYLFVSNFFSDELAKIVLYHHAYYNIDWHESDYVMQYSQLMHIADRICIWHDEIKGTKESLLESLSKFSGTTFSPYGVELFKRADKLYGTWEKLSDKNILDSFLQDEVLSSEEAEEYIYILVDSIDFRSRTTAIHTRSVMEIALEIANIMNLSNDTKKKIYYGALMHDLGKIATPLSILEKPGRLTDEEMEIMRQHVILSGKIIEGCVDDEIVKIAVRHHEKLNGKGYPLGIGEESLTVPERILAVADVLSALCMSRSYKEAYSKERTFGILKSMAESKDLDKDIVNIAFDNFENIIKKVALRVTPVQEKYENMQERFKAIMTQCMQKANQGSLLTNQ